MKDAGQGGTQIEKRTDPAEGHDKSSSKGIPKEKIAKEFAGGEKASRTEKAKK